jgi:hypothetical protein
LQVKVKVKVKEKEKVKVKVTTRKGWLRLELYQSRRMMTTEMNVL